MKIEQIIGYTLLALWFWVCLPSPNHFSVSELSSADVDIPPGIAP